MRVWLIRCAVLAALAVVLWFFGPRAYRVLAARASGASARSIDLDRVGPGPGPAPAWLRGNQALFRGLLEEIAPTLHQRVPDDDATLATVAARLRAHSWVQEVRIRRDAEHGLRLQLELERPVLEVFPVGAVAGAVRPVFVTAAGRCLHRSGYDVPSGLPRCELSSGVIPGSPPRYLLGAEHPDPRVLAAAAVAREWREEIRPRVPGAPPLIEVDAGNLDYRLLADRRTSQVRVVLRRADGGAVRLDYGLPPGQPLPRVSADDKVAVLQRLLARYPGLNGVAQADLRFVNLWERWVRRDPPAAADLVR